MPKYSTELTFQTNYYGESMTSTIIVTPEMTVQTLIDAGVTLAQVQSLLAPKPQSSGNTDRAAFADEIFEMMCADAQANWKNGALLKHWFSGKQADPELEKARVKQHQLISRALADLTKEGRITKDGGQKSASGTFYRVVESAIPATAEAPVDDASDDALIEMIEEAERIEFEDEMYDAEYIASIADSVIED